MNSRIVLLIGALVAHPLRPSQLLDAQGPARPEVRTVIGAHWLQANSLPMHRDALHSGAITVGIRRSDWAFEAGWLRIARSLSTVQGVSLSVGRVLHWGPVDFIPALGVLGGTAEASSDSTGYDFISPQGGLGHMPRYAHSRAATGGGGASLTLEVPLVGSLGVRAVGAQWMLSGAPLEDERNRTLAGVGVVLRFGGGSAVRRSQGAAPARVAR